MNEVEQNGGPLKGFSSKPYRNDSYPQLPTNASYFEHDIRPFVKGVNRGLERLVFGSDGSVNFTDTHYIGAWIKLK